MLPWHPILECIQAHYIIIILSIIVIKLGYKFYQWIQPFDLVFISYKPSYGPTPEKYVEHHLAQLSTIYPYGWSPLMESRDVKKREVVSVNLYDEELVVYRDGEGEVHVFDAYCPHLGANIGIGGTAEGSDRFRCPFHGWIFNTDGKCVGVPGLEKNNLPKASLKKWESGESSRIIWIWRHPDGPEPKYPCITMPNFEEDRFVFLGRSEYTGMLALQDLGENTFDFNHFSTLHRNIEAVPNYPLQRGFWLSLLRRLVSIDWNMDKSSISSVPFDTPLFVGQLPPATLKLMGVPMPPTTVRVELTNPYSLFYRYKSSGVDYFIHATLLPVPIGKIKLIEHYFALEDTIANRITAITAVYFSDLLFQQDSPIWQNKLYRMTPKLTKLDKGIVLWRKWLTQFAGKTKNIEFINGSNNKIENENYIM